MNGLDYCPMIKHFRKLISETVIKTENENNYIDIIFVIVFTVVITLDRTFMISLKQKLFVSYFFCESE